MPETQERLAGGSDGIETAKARLETLEDRVERLRRQALELVQDFRGRYPEGSVPAYITRSPDKSLTPLRWRVLPAESKGSRRRIEITGAEGEAILRRLPAADREIWLDFERRRLDVNTALATASYELARLRAYVQGVREWKRVWKAMVHP
jgi:hypothetical protein